VDLARQVARQNQLQIKGVHIYLGTFIAEADYYLQQLEQLLPLAAPFPHLDYLDLSGGFKAGPEPAFDYRRLNAGFIQLLTTHERQWGQRLGVVLEPGRAIFANTGYFLTRVVEVKRDQSQVWIGVDGSMTLLPLVMLDPGRDHYPVRVVGKAQPVFDQAVTICGASTYSRDYLARQVYLPPVEPGDLLVFSQAGAYTWACASNYLGITRPAQVLADQQEAVVITPREEIRLE
jgi:diaminopimelate decarboxylase